MIKPKHTLALYYTYTHIYIIYIYICIYNTYTSYARRRQIATI